MNDKDVIQINSSDNHFIRGLEQSVLLVYERIDETTNYTNILFNNGVTNKVKNYDNHKFSESDIQMILLIIRKICKYSNNELKSILEDFLKKIFMKKYVSNKNEENKNSKQNRKNNKKEENQLKQKKNIISSFKDIFKFNEPLENAFLKMELSNIKTLRTLFSKNNYVFDNYDSTKNNFDSYLKDKIIIKIIEKNITIENKKNNILNSVLKIFKDISLQNILHNIKNIENYLRNILIGNIIELRENDEKIQIFKNITLQEILTNFKNIENYLKQKLLINLEKDQNFNRKIVNKRLHETNIKEIFKKPSVYVFLLSGLDYEYY